MPVGAGTSPQAGSSPAPGQVFSRTAGWERRAMAFIHEDFLLTTEAARRLYHRFAVQAPILDYHNHLPPKEIAENRRFDNLFQIWLEGDHYKWRAMRANGEAERYCTGD